MAGPKPETILDQAESANRVKLSAAAARAMAAELGAYAGLTGGLRATLAFDDEPAHFARRLVGEATERAEG